MNQLFPEGEPFKVTPVIVLRMTLILSGPSKNIPVACVISLVGAGCARNSLCVSILLSGPGNQKIIFLLKTDTTD